MKIFKKIILVILILMCVIFLCFTVLYFFNIGELKNIESKYKDLESKYKDLEIVNGNLKNSKDELLNEIDNLNSKISELIGENPSDDDNEKECVFIRTLQYIQTIDYPSQDNEKYIVFSQFQTFSPVLLRIDNSININFEKNEYYEIKFKGIVPEYKKYDSLLSEFSIISIKKTNKVGFDQIQESCDF